MLTETELEDLTNGFLDDMINLKEGGLNGRKAEQVKELGTVAECVSTCGVPCENILQS